MTILVDDDNCGTCIYGVGGDGFSAVCSIRDVDIESLNWTYCINLPKYNKNDITVALGPVYKYAPDHYNRKVLIDSPDNQEVRGSLLIEASNIREVLDYHYFDILRDEVIIWQLGEFKEKRAIELLENIQNFNEKIEVSRSFDSTTLSRISLIKSATLALAKISGKESISTGNNSDTGDFCW